MNISIITVNYNDAIGLERTIKSVREQTVENFEHIIIDGGSTDGSKEIIERYVDGFSYWVSEPDAGIYAAMNKGIAQASGDYLLFLNSGDHFFESTSLHTLFHAASKENFPDFVYGNIQVMDVTSWVKTYPSMLSLEYFIKDTLPHPATLIKISMFQNTRYDVSLKIVADWKFFLVQLGKNNASYYYENKLISSFYLGGVSSLRYNELLAERRNVVKAIAPEYLKLHDSIFSKKSKGFSRFAKQFYKKCQTHLKKN